MYADIYHTHTTEHTHDNLQCAYIYTHTQHVVCTSQPHVHKDILHIPSTQTNTWHLTPVQIYTQTYKYIQQTWRYSKTYHTHTQRNKITHNTNFFRDIYKSGWMNNGLSGHLQGSQWNLSSLEFDCWHYNSPSGLSRSETGTLIFGAVGVSSSSVVLIMAWHVFSCGWLSLWLSWVRRTFFKRLTTESPCLVSGGSCFICENSCPSQAVTWVVIYYLPKLP